MKFSPDTETRYFKTPKGSEIYNKIGEGMVKVENAKKEYYKIVEEIGAYGAATYSNKLTPNPMFAYKFGVDVPDFMKKNRNDDYYSFNKKHKLGKEYSKKWDKIESFTRYEIVDEFVNPGNIFQHCGYNINAKLDYYYFVINCEKGYVVPDGLIEISNLEYKEAVDLVNKNSELE